MRSRPTPRLVLPCVGLLAWALTGCESETPMIPPPVAPESTAHTAPATVPGPAVADNAAPPAPASVPSDDPNVLPPPIVPVTEAVDPGFGPSLADTAKPIVKAVDGQVQQTVRNVEAALAPGRLAPAVTPVVDAATQQVGQTVRQVTDEVKQSVRQTADEVKQGVRRKADGLKEELRQKTDALGQKARDQTEKLTSDLLKKIETEAKDAVGQGAK